MAAIGVILLGLAIYKTVEKVHDHHEAKKLQGHGQIVFDYDGANEGLPPPYTTLEHPSADDHKTKVKNGGEKRLLHFSKRGRQLNQQRDYRASIAA